MAAPFAEEFYFRGVLLRWLRSKLPLVVAALISAALFAALHGYFLIQPNIVGWFQTAGIFVLGLVMVALVTLTRSLWSSIIFHAAYNGAVVGLSYLTAAS